MGNPEVNEEDQALERHIQGVAAMDGMLPSDSASHREDAIKIATGLLMNFPLSVSSIGPRRPSKLDGFIDTPSKVPSTQDGFRALGMHAIRKQPRPHNAHGIRNGRKNVDRAKGGGRQGARFRFA